MRVAVPIAKSILRASQRVSAFASRPSGGTVRGGTPAGALFQAELTDAANFCEIVPVIDVPVLITDKTVLDFGSGYGGRTAWLSRWARQVIGIEIVPSQVEASQQATQNRQNVQFVLGLEDRIPFPDDAFDVIVTFDVLEHVKRPDLIIPELARVLRPGGTAIVIFTPYYGAFSHHLNYVSLAPGLHWVFSAETLMDAVADLKAGAMANVIDVCNIPTATIRYDGMGTCLPTLNGLTKAQFVRLLRGTELTIERLTSRPLLDKWRIAGQPGAALNRALCAIPVLDELFSHNLTTVLRKPAELLHRRYRCPSSFLELTNRSTTDRNQ
jgi:2-polyprenyl-3-methyl-5-hydroxy-6-metoxy-1,4-benzoquinol methylase